jgi:hypothetical protein
LTSYRVGELVQVGVEDSQESQEGGPADAAFATLDAADEGCVCSEAVADLFLRESCLAAKFPERSAEGELVSRGRGVVGGLIHRRNARL